MPCTCPPAALHLPLSLARAAVHCATNPPHPLSCAQWALGPQTLRPPSRHSAGTCEAFARRLSGPEATGATEALHGPTANGERRHTARPSVVAKPNAAARNTCMPALHAMAHALLYIPALCSLMPFLARFSAFPILPFFVSVCPSTSGSIGSCSMLHAPWLLPHH